MSSIISFINSSQLQISPQRIFDDTNAFLFDPDKNARLKKVGAKIDRRVMSVYELIDKLMPPIEEQGFDVAAARFKRNMSIASIVAMDQPVPVTGAGSLEEAISNLFKIAIGHSFSEKDRTDFAKMRMAGRIPQSAIDGFIKNLDDLQPKVMRTAIMLSYQLLRTGRVNYLDPRTGLTAQMDYNFVPSLMPAPLTGASAWNQPTTANAILDLQEHTDQFRLINGYYPEMTVMRTEQVRNIQRQQSTRDALIAGQLVNANTIGGTAVSMSQLRTLFEQLQLPPIQVMDAQVEIEPQPGVFTRVNLMNDNEYFFANEGMGNMIFGMTIESDKVGSNYKSGIFVDMNPKTTTDVEEKVLAVGKFVPFIDDPKTLAGRTTHQNN